MALQDLTPQLRTRLNRMEKAVGWFVLLAVLLLLVGFGYYLSNTAQRKGWFIQKVNFQTSLNSATGLKVGDPVMLMGFPVGEITGIMPNDPWATYGVTVYFWVKKPDFGYIWSDSEVKAAAADFLGNRVLEVTKGRYGLATVAETTNKMAVGVLKRDYVAAEMRRLLQQGLHRDTALGILNEDAKTNRASFYTDLEQAEPYWLDPDESPAITERLDLLVTQVEEALPNLLAMTNQLTRVLRNSASVTANLELLSSNLLPASTDLVRITAQLREPGGMSSLTLGTNFPRQLETTLTDAHRLVSHADSNLLGLTMEMGRSLENLADLTSNLNWQVQQNTNLLSSMSDAVRHADELVQGLKRHWLLRSAFKHQQPPGGSDKEGEILRSPRDAEQHR